MTDYTLKVKEELLSWKWKIIKPSGLSKSKAQMKVNNLIPDKVHKVLTESVKGMVKATLLGSNITTKNSRQPG